MPKNLTTLDYPRNLASISDFPSLRSWLRDFTRALDSMTALIKDSPGTVSTKKVGTLPVLENGPGALGSGSVVGFDATQMLIKEVLQ